MSDRSGRCPPAGRPGSPPAAPLRLAAALAVALLAGPLLHLAGLTGMLTAEAARDRASHPVTAVEVATDTPATTRHSSPLAARRAPPASTTC